jgi:hypothetical protein
MEKSFNCCVCGTICELKNLKQFQKKGKIKNICKECVTAIKGLV